MPIPQSDASQMFDHSAYQDKWDRHGRGQVPDRHGAFHRSIAGVLCLPAPAGRGSRCSSTRKLRWELRANKSQRRAVQDPQGPMPCGFTPHRSTIPRPTAVVDEQVRHRSSSKRFLFLANNVRKRCIRTSKCKPRYPLIIRRRIARILFASPAPCCQ